MLRVCADLVQQRSVRVDRAANLDSNPNRICGVQITRIAKSNAKKPEGKHPCRLWATKGESSCKGWHWYNQAAACNKHMQLCHPNEIKSGTIKLYDTRKVIVEKRAGKGGENDNRATPSEDEESETEESETEESKGYGEDGKWEVRELLDRRSEGTDFVYLVLWVTEDGVGDDNSWEPRSSLLQSIPDMVANYDAKFPFGGSAVGLLGLEDGGVSDDSVIDESDDTDYTDNRGRRESTISTKKCDSNRSSSNATATSTTAAATASSRSRGSRSSSVFSRRSSRSSSSSCSSSSSSSSSSGSK